MKSDQNLSTLDDVAALLIQIEPKEPNNDSKLDEIMEALVTIADSKGIPESARAHVVQAIHKVVHLMDNSSDNPDEVISEIGELFQEAMDAMDDDLKNRSAKESQDAVPEENAPEADIIQKEASADKGAVVEPISEVHDKSGSEESRDYMPEDVDSDLIGEFITEGLEIITSAEEALLTLENDPDDMDAVATVFRAFHTIKGTSAFMELNLLANMGHHAESLLSRVRDGEIRYAGGYADLALKSLDMLKKLIEAVEEAMVGGAPLLRPAGYNDLMRVLENPEKTGISEKSDDPVPPRIGEILVAQGKVSEDDVNKAESPRLGDILVAQGKVDREKVEETVADNADKLVGTALVRSKAVSVNDVAGALRVQKKKRSGQKVEASVRVGTERLDRLVDMVGELVIAQSMVAQDVVVVRSDNHELSKKVGQASKIVRGLQDMSMSMRMIPLRVTFQKMVRLVRDVSHKLGKKVTLITEGEDTEIDRNMADVIKDPLVHMVRNAVDHGIEMPEERIKLGKPETGEVRLSAYHSAGNVVVEIRDDGKGLNRDVILEKAREKGIISNGASLSDKEVFNLIFEPGFSTVKEITDVSGRGVGMDVVKKNIELMRGQAEIQSEFGRGTIFQIKLPLTLAIIDGMVVRAGMESYIVPTVSIVTSMKPEQEHLFTIMEKGEALPFQGGLIPLFSIASIFDIKERESDQYLIMVVEDEGNRMGLIVDELIGRQQVVVKSLGESMQNVPGISGGAIMPDGRVGLIIDVGGLIKLANADFSTN